MNEQCLFRFTSGIQCTEPSQHTGAHYHGITQPERDVLERLDDRIRVTNRARSYALSDEKALELESLSADVTDAHVEITQLREWKRKVLEAELVIQQARYVSKSRDGSVWEGTWQTYDSETIAQLRDNREWEFRSLIVAPTEEET